MQITLTNQEIWSYINLLNETFGEEQELTLPAKIAYAIEYNRFILYQKYEFIEKARMNIGKKYGNITEDKTGYNISTDKIELAQMELEQLLSINQVVDVIKLTINELKACNLTLKQMRAILFMIEKEG